MAGAFSYALANLKAEYQRVDLDWRNLKAKSHHAPLVRILGEADLEAPEINQTCQLFHPIIMEIV